MHDLFRPLVSLRGGALLFICPQLWQVPKIRFSVTAGKKRALLLNYCGETSNCNALKLLVKVMQWPNYNTELPMDVPTVYSKLRITQMSSPFPSTSNYPFYTLIKINMIKKSPSRQTKNKLKTCVRNYFIKSGVGDQNRQWFYICGRSLRLFPCIFLRKTADSYY